MKSPGATINGQAGLRRQHLIDPDLCTACLSCAEHCPKNAIFERNRVVAIDPALCDDCEECLPHCATAAIEAWRMMPADQPYSLEEQFGWTRLPPPELF